MRRRSCGGGLILRLPGLRQIHLRFGEAGALGLDATRARQQASQIKEKETEYFEAYQRPVQVAAQKAKEREREQEAAAARAEREEKER